MRVEPRPLAETVDSTRKHRHHPHHKRAADTPASSSHVNVDTSVQTVTHAATQPGGRCTTVLHPSAKHAPGTSSPATGSEMDLRAVPPVLETPPSTAASTSASTRTLIRMNSFERVGHCGSWRRGWKEKAKCWRWSLSGFARGYYAPFLQKLQVKVRDNSDTLNGINVA